MKKKIRSNILRGLLILLPAMLTIYLIYFLVEKADRIVGTAISKLFVLFNVLPPFPIDIAWLGLTFENRIPGLGFIATVMILFGFGMLAKSFTGKIIIRITEKIFSKIPLARSIYSTIKQLTNVITKDNKSFKQVVFVEYPRKGIFTVGFYTGDTSNIDIFNKKTEKKFANVFLPTSPNPTSGWVIIVPKDEIIFSDMSVEDGIKFVVSGGAVAPVVKS